MSVDFISEFPTGKTLYLTIENEAGDFFNPTAVAYQAAPTFRQQANCPHRGYLGKPRIVHLNRNRPGNPPPQGPSTRRRGIKQNHRRLLHRNSRRSPARISPLCKPTVMSNGAAVLVPVPINAPSNSVYPMSMYGSPPTPKVPSQSPVPCKRTQWAMCGFYSTLDQPITSGHRRTVSTPSRVPLLSQ